MAFGNRAAKSGVRELASVFPRRTLAASAGLLVAASVFSVAASYQVGVLVGDGSWGAVALFALFAVMSEVPWTALHLTWSSAVHHAGSKWRKYLLERVLGQSVHELGESSTGGLVDRIDDDVDLMVDTLGWPFLALASSMFTAVLAVVVAAVIEPWTFAGFVALGALVAFVSWKLTPQAAAALEIAEEASTAVMVTLEEAVVARDDLRSTGGRAFALTRFANLSADYLDTVRMAVAKTTKIRGSVLVIFFVIVVGATAAMTVAVAIGQVDVGAAVSVVALAVTFSSKVERAVNEFPKVIDSAGAFRRVLALASVDVEPQGEPFVELTDGAVEFRDVTFTYPHATAISLENVSLHLDDGGSLGLVGRSGAGKSTMVALLTRQVDTPRGCVFLGGVDVCDIPLEQLRSQVQVVTQLTELVAGSVYDNVALFGGPRRRCLTSF